MNRSYKSIWNEATGTFVAVAENVNTKGKRSSGSKSSARAAIKAVSSAFLFAGISAVTLSTYAETGTGGGTGFGTAISECKGRDQANAGKKESIAIGCGSLADNPLDKDTNFYDRENPHNSRW